MRLTLTVAYFIALLSWGVPLATAQETTSAIRSFLEGLDAGGAPVIAGRELNEPAALSSVYRVRNHAPLWLPGGELHSEITNMLTAIDQSVNHGFFAQRYHRAKIESLVQARDSQSRLALELLLTDAFLSQALHRSRGAIYPPNLDADWRVPPAEVDASALLLAMLNSERSVIGALDTLWPHDPEYTRLLARRVEIAASGDEISVPIASGPLIRPGQSGERVIMLKQRLMGPGEYSAVYDEDLRHEVIAFQRTAGLEPDAVVGANTLEMLNVTRVSWLDTIDANLERWRWLPRDTPETYIRVNIAAYTLRAMDRGEPALSMNVIVGKPYRRTPVFTETIKYMVLNPSWNVPYSIATKDKLPLLKADASAQAAKGFEAKPPGSDTFVPVDAIDWSKVTVRSFNYLLRQRAGPQNALGQIKFMLPNPYAVYLHDTANRELFAHQERSFSSGCVRLERPLELAAWLLSRENHADAQRVPAVIATGETKTIYLKRPVPTYLVYFTAFSLGDDEVTFRRDIYGRDRVLIEALRAQ